MSQAPSWHRSNLRKLFAKILPGDPEIDALCCDYFPEIKRLFAAGMDRLTKETLMLERIELPEVVAALSDYSPAEFFRWAHLLEPTGIAFPPITASSESTAPNWRPPREDAHDHHVFLHSAQNSTEQRWQSRLLQPALQHPALSGQDETAFHLGLPCILANEQAVPRCRVLRETQIGAHIVREEETLLFVRWVGDHTLAEQHAIYDCIGDYFRRLGGGLLLFDLTQAGKLTREHRHASGQWWRVQNKVDSLALAQFCQNLAVRALATAMARAIGIVTSSKPHAETFSTEEEARKWLVNVRPQLRLATVKGLPE